MDEKEVKAFARLISPVYRAKSGQQRRFVALGVTLALVVGILFRFEQFLATDSLWPDEGFLLLNVQTYDLHRLLTGPLDAVQAIFGQQPATQAAPPGFLVVLKWIVGNQPTWEWPARVFPFVCSLVALVLFARLAGEWLHPKLAPWVVLAFGASPALIFQAATCKQYSSDVLCAVLLTMMATTRMGNPVVRLLLLGVFAPVMLLFSHPAALIAPCAVVALWMQVERAKRFTLAHVLGHGVVLAWLVGCVLVIKRVFIEPQRDPFLNEYWASAFADWSDPVSVLTYLAVNTFEIINYPAPVFVAVALAAAVVCICCRGWAGKLSWPLLVVLGGPLVGACVLGLLGEFPYRAQRVMTFAFPALMFIPAYLLSQHLAAAATEAQPRPLPKLAVWVVMGQAVITAVWALPNVYLPTRQGDYTATVHAAREWSYNPPGRITDKLSLEKPWKLPVAIVMPLQADGVMTLVYGFNEPKKKSDANDRREAIFIEQRQRVTGKLPDDQPVILAGLVREGRSDRVLEALRAHPLVQERPFLQSGLFPGGVVCFFGPRKTQP